MVVALNKIERAMTKLGYALHKGEVFKRNEESMYTYEHACSIKKFISLLANNDILKEIIIPNFNKLESILADPECEFTNQLKINYDLIEVSNSWCFSISRRAFVQNPVKEIGVARPRAFLHYAHIKESEAKYFQEILQKLKWDTSANITCAF